MTPFVCCFRKGIILLILLIFCNGCAHHSKNSPQIPITQEEYVWLEKFFRYFLFYESSIYTVVGSKPVTSFYIHYEKDKYNQLSRDDLENYAYFELNQDNKKDRAFYATLSKDQKEKALLITGHDFIYNFSELWDKWEGIQNRISLSKKFLLVKREWPIERTRKFEPNYCEKVYEILFINVLNAALVIQENYELFKKVVGHEFDPVGLVFEIEDENSEFWNKMRGEEAYKYSYLWGILYGFGRENAFSYLWKGRHIKNLHTEKGEEAFAESLVKWNSNKRSFFIGESNAHSIGKFLIPHFASYSENDPIVLKYEREREEIKKLYKGKDFVQFSLELLTQNHSSQG